MSYVSVEVEAEENDVKELDKFEQDKGEDIINWMKAVQVGE